MTSLRRVAIVTVLFVLTALPINPLGKLFVAGFAGVYDSLFLSGHSIGTGGQARMTSPPLPNSTVAEGSDSVLTLSALGQKAELGLNLRQRVWLPILLQCALLFALRLPRSPRLLAAGFGALSVLILAALSLHLTALWSLAKNFPSLVPLSSGAAETLDVAISLLVLPPSNPYVLPVVCAASVLVLLRPRQAAEAPVDHVSPAAASIAPSARSAGGRRRSRKRRAG